MALKDDVEQLRTNFRDALAALEDADATEKASPDERLEDLRRRFLGRKGTLQGLLGGLKNLEPADRAAAGKELNLLKREIELKLETARATLETRRRDEELRDEWVDVTLDSTLDLRGRLHPTSRIQYEIEDVFTSLGFEVLDGPYVETEYYNFEALNTPEYHPARDMQDTFYLEDGNLLRTHTSCIQVRGMERLKPPFKIIGPGKVFRCERIDASHEATFHQLEGMMVDRDIKVSNLIYFMKLLLSEIFKRQVEVRLRPGYFPFVEPGFELDIRCLICDGKGCSVCKRVGWVELLPCGMVHPNVLRHGKIDPDAYSGFAFGLGLDRLVMMKYKIDDIRHLHGGDLRFLEQFP